MIQGVERVGEGTEARWKRNGSAFIWGGKRPWEDEKKRRSGGMWRRNRRWVPPAPEGRKAKEKQAYAYCAGERGSRVFGMTTSS